MLTRKLVHMGIQFPVRRFSFMDGKFAFSAFPIKISPKHFNLYFILIQESGVEPFGLYCCWWSKASRFVCHFSFVVALNQNPIGIYIKKYIFGYMLKPSN